MKDKLIRLNYNEKEIILIPTAHVSSESADLVRETIKEEDPDSICIELDDQRYKNLKQNQVKRWLKELRLQRK